jgi:hypothetical protein
VLCFVADKGDGSLSWIAQSLTSLGVSKHSSEMFLLYFVTAVVMTTKTTKFCFHEG